MIRVIIPAYNEERNIKHCLLSTSKELKKSGEKFKIYIVNDGSKDKTARILNALIKILPILVITHRQNRGPSEAFRSGFKKTTTDSTDNDIIILMEGDGTSDPKLLHHIISKIKNGFDLVICSRFVRNGKYKNFPLKRFILSYAANLILKILFPIKGVRDYTIFYRGYRASLVKKLIEKYRGGFIKTKHYVANSEILIKCATFTNRIVEIPFIYDYGNKKNASAMKIVSNIKSYFRFIFKNLF